MNNGKSILVEWSQILARTNTTTIKFTQSDGILLTAKYDVVGTFTPQVNVTNPLGSIVLKFCSQMKVVAKSLDKLANIQAQESCSLRSNLVLLKNANVISKLGDAVNKIELGKGITNTFSLGYTGCNSTENSLDSELAMYWHLRRVDTYWSEKLARSVEYEVNIPGGCMRTTTVESIVFEANSLSAGDYILTVYAFDFSYPEEFYTMRKRLVVGASPLIIRMNNPVYMELNWNEELKLDFVRDSYDPDVAGDSSDSIAFDLLCVKNADIGVQLAVLDSARSQARLGNFDFRSSSMELYFHSENVRVFSRECFAFNSTDPSPSPIQYSDKIVSVPGLKVSLNFTEARPMLFEVLAHKDSRMAVSERIELSLNISSAFQIKPSTNLDDMSNQLNMVDDLVAKNPKKALGLYMNSLPCQCWPRVFRKPGTNPVWIGKENPLPR